MPVGIACTLVYHIHVDKQQTADWQMIGHEAVEQWSPAVGRIALPPFFLFVRPPVK